MEEKRKNKDEVSSRRILRAHLDVCVHEDNCKRYKRENLVNRGYWRMMIFAGASEDIAGVNGKGNKEHPGFDGFCGPNTAEERPGICPNSAEIQYRQQQFQKTYEETHDRLFINCQDTQKRGELQRNMPRECRVTGSSPNGNRTRISA